MDIAVCMPLEQALDRCWETLAELFEPQELLIRQSLIEKYYRGAAASAQAAAS